jgi:tetratricopeptide (TPR) repeat protein
MRHSTLSWAVFVGVLSLASRSWSGEREWVFAATPNFKVISDDGEASARRVAKELEQIRAAFAQLLKIDVEVGRPVTVIAARDEQTARRLAPDLWERRGGAGVGGFAVNVGNKFWAVARMDVPDPAHTVRHEYVHLLVASGYGGAPPWLNEGLAEFYGAARFSGDEVEVGRIDERLLYLRDRAMLPIDRLVAVDYGSPEYEEEGKASVFYAQSAALTHYLLIADHGKHRARLSEYLRLLAEEDVDDRTALQRAFGGADKLRGELEDYVKRSLFSSFKGRIAFPEERVTVRTLRPAQAQAILADFLIDRGNLAAARAQLEAAIAAEPGLADARLHLARVLTLEMQTEKAPAAFAEALRLMPSSVLAHYYYGASALPGIDAGAREAALRKAVTLAPGYAPAQAALAYRLVADRPDEAWSAARAALAADPANVITLITLLRVASKLGRAEEIQRVERLLLRRVRTDRGALAALVAHYEIEGSTADAEALLKRVRSQSPRNLLAVKLQVGLLTRHERFDEVEVVLREGLAIERKTPDLLNQLAYHNAERGVKLEEAQKLVDEALKMYPTSAVFLDTKGWVLFRLGRTREAEDQVRRSLAVEEHPEVRDHLGDILDKAGRAAEALECWRQALAHPATDDKLKSALTTKIEKASTPAAAN